jgi:hypothetical protein
MIDPEFKAFLVGLVGNLGVELVALLRSYQRGPKYVAQRYRDKGFWVTRICSGLVSGFVAWLCYVPGLSPLVTLWIGAATPRFLTQLSKTPLADGD